MKILKLKGLTVLGLTMITALVATSFAAYNYGTATQIHAGDEESGGMHGEHYGMHGHWEEMRDECMETMDGMHEEEHSSTIHNETKEFYHHHGCP